MAKKGQLKAIEMILKLAPERINERAPGTLQTPLHVAAEIAERADSVAVLLECAADPNLRDQVLKQATAADGLQILCAETEDSTPMRRELSERGCSLPDK